MLKYAKRFRGSNSIQKEHLDVFQSLLAYFDISKSEDIIWGIQEYIFLNLLYYTVEIVDNNLKVLFLLNAFLKL